MSANLNCIRDLKQNDEPKQSMKFDMKSECLLCGEEIFDLLHQAENEHKGGQQGVLSLWICDQEHCGTMFCISCAVQWQTQHGIYGSTSCPACTRNWNTDQLKLQKEFYDITPFEW
ncbi:uncharacterized protein L201_001194 [Kwoniella dendrophila CBS 6074]|uniref:RING-type domain-containing protein n=1 Tax=Kwoniella dendrophila CBS 6074 TaxID=1295534 RepID=A0AAX4JLN1_9TREE